MTTRVDLLVVGAGPAGTAAALTARAGGLDVLVVDRARFPRDKCCGDGLTTLALRELEALGLRPEGVAGWTDVDQAWLRGPSGREVALPLPAGRGRFVAVAPRLDLDAALVELARAAGATVADGCALAGVDPSQPDAVTVDVEGVGAVEASYVIGADGMWSPLRKALGAGRPGYLGEWHAFRQYLHAPGEAARRMWVWFEPDLLPGYAWSFPVGDGRANVGFGILRGGRWGGRDMAALWPQLLQRPHVRAVLGDDARPDGPHRAWPIPARPDQVLLSRGRALFVGDAAAAADVLTGEGIGQALLTGRLAAEAVVAAGAGRPAQARTTYEEAVRRELLADHRMSARLGRLLVRPGAVDATLALVDASAWTRRNFARWLFEDEPRAVLGTPRRWHRGFLDRDGAYVGRAAADR